MVVPSLGRFLRLPFSLLPFLLLVGTAIAQPVRRIDFDEAVRLALEQVRSRTSVRRALGTERAWIP